MSILADKEAEKKFTMVCRPLVYVPRAIGVTAEGQNTQCSERLWRVPSFSSTTVVNEAVGVTAEGQNRCPSQHL